MDCHIYKLEGISYDLTLVIIGLYNEQCRYQAMYLAWEVFPPLDSISATKTQSSPSSSGPSGTIFKLDCGYHLCASCKDINLHADEYGKSLSARLVGLNTWIWLLQHLVKGLITPFAYYNLLKVWQISLRQTCVVLSIDLTIS